MPKKIHYFHSFIHSFIIRFNFNFHCVCVPLGGRVQGEPKNGSFFLSCFFGRFRKHFACKGKIHRSIPYANRSLSSGFKHKQHWPVIAAFGIAGCFLSVPMVPVAIIQMVKKRCPQKGVVGELSLLHLLNGPKRAWNVSPRPLEQGKTRTMSTI